MGALRSRSLLDAAVEPAISEAAVVVCRPVATAAELAEYHALRQSVFVTEQGLFEADDRDRHDGDPATIHVLAFAAGIAGGTVRLYPAPSEDEPGLWKGDRLAVRSGRRHAGLGGPLVQQAVRLAGAAGGSRMVAFVQMANVRFFEHLGWRSVGEPAPYVGQLHQQMTIGLP